MRIFISWSGDRSKFIATALADLLPDVFHGIETWMSEHAVGAGVRWGAELTRALEECNFGILCLTPENINASWLIFEAGSLAKSVSEAKVVPYLFDLLVADVPYPLAQFNGVSADQDGTLKLIESINNSLEKSISSERLSRVFSRWWPDLENKLQGIPSTQDVELPKRSDRALMEEVLELSRSLAKESLQPKLDPFAVTDLVASYEKLIEVTAETGITPSMNRSLQRMHSPLKAIVMSSGQAGSRAGKRLSKAYKMLHREIQRYVKAGGVILPKEEGE